MDITSFTNLCRLCLEPDQANVSIFKENENGVTELYDKISVCLPVKLSEDDCLPKNICNTCHKSVDFIYNFWQLSSNSEKQLQSMLGNAKYLKNDNDDQIGVDNTIILYDTLDVKDVIAESKDEAINEGEVEIKEVYFGEYLNQCDSIEDENTVLINEDDSHIEAESETVTNEILSIPVSDAVMAPPSNTEDIQISQIVESSNVSLRKIHTRREGNSGRSLYLSADEVKLKCVICEQYFPDELDLNKHLTQKHKKYRCIYCDKIFNQRSSLAYHRFVHTSERKYTCEKCNLSFKRKGDLRGHISRVHEEVKESEMKACSVCDFKSKDRRRYDIHVLSHVGSFLYYCDQCGKGFNDNLGLKTHLNNHLGVKPYQCDICGKKFTREPYMKQHRRKVHEQPLSFECDMCGKKFSFKCSLKHHFRIHEGKTEEYKCHICERMIKSKASLRNHLKLHTGEKPYSCTECSKTFATRLQLQRHSFRHQDYKPYPCKICKKEFAYKRLLVIHEEIHQENRIRHSCHYCDNQYYSKTKLKLHLLKHHSFTKEK